MRSLCALISSAGRSFAHHFDRLRRTVRGLLRRVRDAVHDALEDERAATTRATPPRRDGEDAYGPEGPSGEYKKLPPPESAAGRKAGSRWARALAAVLRAAARWLLPPPGRYIGVLGRM